MDLNYYDTFIMVAADCPVSSGVVPTVKKETKSKPMIEYELLSQHPYTYTQEDLIYEVHIRHKSISDEELTALGTQIRDELFEKSHPCMRASMLPTSILMRREKRRCTKWNRPSIDISLRIGTVK